MDIERVSFESLANGGDDVTGALVKLDSNSQVLSDAIGVTDSSAEALSNKVDELDGDLQLVANRVTRIETIGSVASGFKNKLMNGDGRINNRRFGGGSLAVGVFGYDRWKASASGTGVACNAGLWTLNGAMMQSIELDTANPITGKVVTVSVVDPSGPITVQLSGTTQVSGVIAAGAGQKSVTLTMPASGAASVACVLTTAGNTTFRNVQLELGSVATPFESRELGIEELLCARYCPAFRSTSNLALIGTGQGASATQTTPVLNFRANPRVPPTGVVVSSPTHFAVSQASTVNTNCTSITFGSSSLAGAVVVTGGSSGLVAGNQSLFFFNNAAGWLYFEGCDF